MRGKERSLAKGPLERDGLMDVLNELGHDTDMGESYMWCGTVWISRRCFISAIRPPSVPLPLPPFHSRGVSLSTRQTIFTMADVASSSYVLFNRCSMMGSNLCFSDTWNHRSNPEIVRRRVRITSKWYFSRTPVFRPFTPPVLSASGLPKRNLFRLPDPFVVVSVDGVEKFASSTVKKSLNPFWNDFFDV